MPGTRRRRNQADIEIAKDEIWNETAIRSLLDDWIVPMVVEQIIEEMGTSQVDCNPEIIMHTIIQKETADGESYEAGTAPQACPAETNVSAPTTSDSGGAPGAQPVRGAAPDDGE